jgi:AcrR family transcriptional regulator
MGSAPGSLERTDPARDRIVTAAADLFFRKGIRATGVDTLIEEANVAKSTF